MNTWIKDSFLDLLALLFIAFYSFTLNEILEVVIWIYTSLLLLSKILYFFVRFLQTKAIKSNAPIYLAHIVYFLSISLLVYSQNYFLSATWLLIWVLSAIPQFKIGASHNSQ